MKLNIADPHTGGQAVFNIEDERRSRVLVEKRIGQEFEGDLVDESLKGYVFKITGGHDKQGFAMYQGVALNARVRLMINNHSKCYRRGRQGERVRRSVRGCIVDSDISALNVIVTKRGSEPLAGITDVQVPRRLGPKRASKIRKLFKLDKEDDVRNFVIRREIVKDGKKRTRAPKIQRLVTPQRLLRKQHQMEFKKTCRAKTATLREQYHQLLVQRRQVALEKKRAKSGTQPTQA